MTISKFHYFASCAFGWATASTQDLAVKKLAQSFRSDVKRCITNALKEGQPGFYVWTCKVHEPADAHYSIEYFQPKDVEKSEMTHHHVTHITQKSVAYYTHLGEIS